MDRGVTPGSPLAAAFMNRGRLVMLGKRDRMESSIMPGAVITVSMEAVPSSWFTVSVAVAPST